MEVVNSKARRVWFITDTHLGVRNNSNEWIEYIDDYFFKWFFPLVEREWREGDVLLHLGDYYDSRQSVNLKVLDLGVRVCEKFSEIFKDGVYFIIGNHDIWGKTTNEINSLKSIKWIPGITVFEDPVTLILDGKKFFMMPWRKDHEEEELTLEKTGKHDYLCCHTDIRGLKFNKSVAIEEGTEIEKFKKFGRVYSGHIHYSQEVDNIKMLGSPYEITRSDMNNPKGITLLNLSDGKETFFLNDFSPMFKRFFFDDILNLSPEEAEPLFRNNFVDIMIDPKMALKAPLNIITEIIQSQRRLSFHPYDPDQATSLSMQMIDTDGKNFNVVDFIRDYIDHMDLADSAEKEKLKKTLIRLHQSVVSKMEQEKSEI